MTASRIEQGTPEWFASRLGKVTASRVADVMARTRSGPSASRQSYLAELVCERLTGKSTVGYVNAAMERGTALEPEARAAYEAMTGNLVTEVAFIDHPSIDMFGASPDGLIGDDGLVEIKCMGAAGHLDALKKGPQSKHVIQMQVQLMVTGRAWCDYCAYHPDFPYDLRLAIVRIPADAKHQGAIEAEVREFLAEIDLEINALQALRNSA